MIRVLTLAAVLFTPVLILAQEREAAAPGSYENPIELPFAAQKCVLPVAPPPSQETTYDALISGRERMKAFQQKIVTYRKCLDSTRNDEGLTTGNDLALTNAYNYSVEMEERVAENFNKAVREYNASIKKD
jgi:hypothetical protein